MAAQARLTISPASPAPGALVRLTLRDAAPRSAVVDVKGQMAGEPLHFTREGATWTAYGAVPVDAQGKITARAVIERAARVDTATGTVVIPRVKVATDRLRVDSNFSRPMDKATTDRIARENERARDVARRSHSTPRLWSGEFMKPRTSVVTGLFGSGRLFNGTVTSRHLGVDFRGAVGEPIRATNRGVVALVDTFFLAGTVVYIDHGEGIVTGYFHMSKPLVAIGDTVRRGQEIGLVGQSGRVTGPHLHWSARYGSITVNPLDLIDVIK
jgi:murein DD-endopeptidase MepM/ murein hydrolase activator NlpD